jgi:hypothetical protein
MVLALLFIAEAQRCCTDDDEADPRIILDDDYIYRLLAEQIGPEYDYETECSCLAWGSRTYGGLGTIEPFTSLIALRIFRFVISNLLVHQMDQNNSKKNKDDSSDDTDKDQSSDPHSHDHSHGHENHGHGHGHDGGETVLELWDRAISEHPEIVEKYGWFSCQPRRLRESVVQIS